MLGHAILTLELAAAIINAAPTPGEDPRAGPPVIFQTGPADPLVTATVLGSDSVPTGVAKRQAAATCFPQPAGISHKSAPDTAASFNADTFYSTAANGAQPPSGFTTVFQNQYANTQSPNYLGYTLLPSYDVQGCATKCNAIKGCQSFNIYFERDPSVNPDSPNCSDPASVTNVKCVWWGSVITPQQLTNQGQYRGRFNVVIAGSNGYRK